MKKGDARKQCQVELKFHSQVNRVIYNPLKKKKKKKIIVESQLRKLKCSL